VKLGRRSGSRRARGSARLLTAIVILALFLTACVSNAPQDALQPAGHESRMTYHLFVPVFWIAAAVFILVEALIVIAVVRFRARSDDEAPVQIHGSRKLETAWTIAPALLLGTIGIFTIKTVFDVSRIPKGPNVMHAKVIGHRWWWEFQYPDTGVVTANELVIPTGKRVVLDMTSVDVIHSFWPPKLAGKIDVVPGQINRMIVEADHPDTYFGQCAEYCGTSHANMRFRVVAMSQADFDTWMAGQRKPGALLTASTTSTSAGTSTSSTTASAQTLAAQGQNLFMTKGCAGCHTVTGISAGTVGPNLTHLQTRTVFAGGIFELNNANLRKWLRDPPAEKPDSVMPNLKLSEAEIDQLIAYLDTLK
jgi:cytochrome c oxidase subunit 2